MKLRLNAVKKAAGKPEIVTGTVELLSVTVKLESGQVQTLSGLYWDIELFPDTPPSDSPTDPAWVKRMTEMAKAMNTPFCVTARPTGTWIAECNGHSDHGVPSSSVPLVIKALRYRAEKQALDARKVIETADKL